MKVSLVTGGAGFIGSHVCRELLKLGHDIVVLDDLSGGFKENLPDGVTFFKGSITDHQLVEELFERFQINYVYHFAAYAAEGLSHFIKRFNYQNNLVGSVNLINEAVKHKIKCFVFTSSIAVYGDQESPLSEEMIPRPEDPYGIAKFAVEMELMTTKEMFGLNYIIFRPHNVFGEYQNIGDRYRNVVGIFMNQLMQGKPLTIFGDGYQTRAFSYIGDVAPQIAGSIYKEQAYNQIFNIGSDQKYTVNELAEAVMKAMNIEGKVRHVQERNEVKHAYADHSKTQKIFGSQSSDNLEENLKKMAVWVKKTGIKRSKTFRDIEINKNLPSVWLEK